MASEAARLAEALRAAKKAQSLSGTKIAEQIEWLTGSRPSAMWLTRRLRGDAPLIRVSSPCGHCGVRTVVIDPLLAPMTSALGLSLSDLLRSLTDDGSAVTFTEGTVSGQRGHSAVTP